MRIAALLVALAAVCLTGCASTREGRGDGDAHLAHGAYVEAINSNDLDAIMGMMTEDVVFMTPHAAPVVGKAAVREWVAGYLEAFHTRWDKAVEEFTPAGEWAFERYSYVSTDTPRGGGEAVRDTGWGFIVYHREGDGVWRVARDAFGSDRPLSAP